MEEKQKKLLSFKDFIMEDVEYEFLAELFPKQEITLVYGTYGSGKSYSTIKALNKGGIKPFYINLDHTAGLSNLNYYNLNEKILDVISQIKEFDENSVVILDTYTVFDILMASRFGKQLEPAAIYNILDTIRKSYNGTLIVIGHSADLATRDSLFKDNPILARNAAEVLFVEKTEYKATAKKEARTEYVLHVNKGRGNGGARQIENWMR